MALFTKCILHPKEKSDGLRISIMSRHTLSDGRTPDDRITSSSFDIHAPSLAPSPKLVGDYYLRDLSWDAYETRYLMEIRKKHNQILKITKFALTENVTVLCIEDTPDKCHRRLFAEECKRLVPELEIDCK